MLHFEVKNLGPIAEGAVDLKPLTIFTGKNNVGKSYMAMLIYAALRASRRGHFGDFPFGDFPFVSWGEVKGKLYIQRIMPGMMPDVERVFAKRAVGDMTMEKGSKVLLPPYRVLQQLKEKVSEATSKMADSFAKGLSYELQRCFATSVSSLRCQGQTPNGLTISFKWPELYMKFSCSEATLKALRPEPNISDEVLQRTLQKATKQSERFSIKDAKIHELVLDLSLSEISMRLFGELRFRPYYLPAARSGILQSHKALASYIVSRSPLAGIEDMEIPKFSGVIADFLSSLLRLEKRKSGKLNELAKFLESEVTRGDIEIKVDENHYPEIFYKTGAGRFALHRTSSMVSELAPIILFLRHVVEPGDLLIIEEPEAHLHPENQRKLARALVGVVRANLKVIITTHSDFLVQQLSNFVALSQTSEEERVRYGYSPGDYLKPEDVGAYKFRSDETKGGSIIDELTVDSEEGIRAEEFDKEAEQLYEQSVTLQEKILRDK